VNPSTALAAGWDPVAALAGMVREMWALGFMVNAFRAGTLTALLAGVTGWFMVARRQTFAGHTLSVVGFPGAAGAVLAGVPVWAGYLGFTIATALVLGRGSGSGSRRPGSRRPGSRRPGSRQPGSRRPGCRQPGGGEAGGASGGGEGDGALIGTVQAFALGCGFWFVALYAGLLGGTTSLLFGSFLGITTGQVLFLAVVTATVLGALAVLGRRLLFVTVDPAVAQARGVPARGMNLLFLLLLALAVAATVQVTGALLVFALLVLPAATAQRLTTRPGLAIALSVLFALAVVWVALTVAFYTPYPFGFWLTTLAFAGYLAATAAGRLAERWPLPPSPRPGRRAPAMQPR
jgi:zinc/manganese transport system permease protein